VEEVPDSRAAFCGRPDPVGDQRFRNQCGDSQTRVERSDGILKNRLKTSPEGTHSVRGKVADEGAVKVHRPGVRPLECQEEATQGRLARPGLANQSV
jgi:hypothetical protein